MLRAAPRHKRLFAVGNELIEKSGERALFRAKRLISRRQVLRESNQHFSFESITNELLVTVFVFITVVRKTKHDSSRRKKKKE